MPALDLVILKNQKCLVKNIEIKNLSEPTETVNLVRAVPNMFSFLFPN